MQPQISKLRRRWVDASEKEKGYMVYALTLEIQLPRGRDETVIKVATPKGEAIGELEIRSLGGCVFTPKWPWETE